MIEKQPKPYERSGIGLSAKLSLVACAWVLSGLLVLFVWAAERGPNLPSSSGVMPETFVENVAVGADGVGRSREHSDDAGHLR